MAHPWVEFFFSLIVFLSSHLSDWCQIDQGAIEFPVWLMVLSSALSFHLRIKCSDWGSEKVGKDLMDTCS